MLSKKNIIQRRSHKSHGRAAEIHAESMLENLSSRQLQYELFILQIWHFKKSGKQKAVVIGKPKQVLFKVSHKPCRRKQTHGRMGPVRFD